MDGHTASLSNLRGIVLPEPPPLWPLAPGAWVLVVTGICLVSFIIYTIARNRQRNRYRKSGLHLLDDAKTVYDLSLLLKRVALAAFPRRLVAPLHGEEWRGFLNETCRSSHFHEGLSSSYDSPADQNLIENARIWIKNHSAAGYD